MISSLLFLSLAFAFYFVLRPRLISIFKPRLWSATIESEIPINEKIEIQLNIPNSVPHWLFIELSLGAGFFMVKSICLMGPIK
ncbi:MAG TPA: hypothetical protein VG347_02050 [Verrucomicrobiae bacterium]|nr:hypothetical protein [Verrucomicrobiae bacterium]